ncbi:hypothetical protein K0M31_006919 [Melipona bicolor]|uniref:Uncharacterized protein n=1 Tax=Melipona bicolor TaxID=60889 RepID=A0AA40FRD6_9HYME|nr:hypothetical protein K0M31_006919 [Melipona bicolor]
MNHSGPIVLGGRFPDIVSVASLAPRPGSPGPINIRVGVNQRNERVGDSLFLEVSDRLGDPLPPELRPSACEFKASYSIEIARWKTETKKKKTERNERGGWIRIAWDGTTSVYIKAEAAVRLCESSVHR